jgi:hypothetical protein
VIAPVILIFQRVSGLKSQPAAETQNTTNNRLIQLFPFAGNYRDNIQKDIPFNLVDYLELVDWTGRIIREDKRGHIAQNLPAILRADLKDWLAPPIL